MSKSRWYEKCPGYQNVGSSFAEKRVYFLGVLDVLFHLTESGATLLSEEMLNLIERMNDEVPSGAQVRAQCESSK